MDFGLSMFTGYPVVIGATGLDPGTPWTLEDGTTSVTLEDGTTAVTTEED